MRRIWGLSIGGIDGLKELTGWRNWRIGGIDRLEDRESEWQRGRARGACRCMELRASGEGSCEYIN